MHILKKITHAKNYFASQKTLLISIPKCRNASRQLAIYRGDYSNLFVVQKPKSKRGFGKIFHHVHQNEELLLHDISNPTVIFKQNKQWKRLILPPDGCTAWRDNARRKELGSFQWRSVPRSEIMGTNWHTEDSFWTPGSNSVLCGCWSSGTGCPEAVVCPPARCSKAIWT